MANWYMFTNEGNEAVEAMVRRLESVFTPEKSFAELQQWVQAEVSEVEKKFPEVRDSEPRNAIKDKMDEFFLRSIKHSHLLGAGIYFEWL
jgi:hypothetical protein